MNKLKKIYVLNSEKQHAKKPALIVMGNSEYGEQILIGGELGSEIGEDITLEYKLLKKDFSFSAANQVKLPVKVIGNCSQGIGVQ